MKVITLWQPYATAIALGLKRIETRGWRTHYRGILAIHAAGRSPDLSDLSPALLNRLRAGAGGSFPSGQIVAVVTLADCVPSAAVRLLYPRRINATELALGSFGPGRWAWILSDVIAIEPIVYRSRQGLHDLPTTTEKALRSVLLRRQYL